jgi:hypothetical protein
MTKHRIKKLTGDYQKWLINSLKDKKEAVVYLQTALDEYQIDQNIEALLLALHHVTKAASVFRLSIKN